jgi:LacI family transcriptional regulator
VSIAQAAAIELTKHNPKTIAYVGWPERQFWSIRREEAFADYMEKNGRAVQRLHLDDSKSHRAVIKQLVSYLPTLERPIGIFTATDAMSESVLAAALQLNLSVPDDLMIIGVDNDEFICENAKPTLSSIAPGFERAGRQAIAILDKLMRAKTPKAIVEKFKEASLVTRSSTRRSSQKDRSVTIALDYIRAHAADGISAAQVIGLFTCSRCLAERRFKSVTGHSILDEIHDVQIETAKKLIVKPFQKLDAVPQLCGHSSTAFFQRLFKRKTGLTMSEWRSQN